MAGGKKNKKVTAATRLIANAAGKADKSEVNGLKQRMDKVMRLFPKGSFGNLGGTAGMAFGGPAGAAVGSALGRGLSAITGYGNYAVKMNSISTMSTSVDSVPQFIRNDHSVRVIHREYVKDVVVPTNPTLFNNNTFAINPSNVNLFPWLSNMSRQYQQYNVRGMIVEFKSMSSDYAASGPLGTVAIATNYNVNDLPFGTKIALENSEFAVSCKPSLSLIHAIECDPEFSGRKFYYVRDAVTESPALSDARLYDVGLLQVATAGLPGVAGATLGELWVSYDIEFTKPVLPGISSVAYVDGFALTSQKDGVSSPIAPEIGRIVFTQTSLPALVPSVSIKPFIGSLANIALSLDTQLNGAVCEIAANGDLTVKKDGYYSIIWKLSCTTGPTMRSLSSDSALPIEGLTTVGSFANQLPLGFETCAQHSYAIAGTFVTMFLATKDVLVSGCGANGTAGSYVVFSPPSVVTYSAALASPARATCEVTWTQLAPARVAV